MIERRNHQATVRSDDRKISGTASVTYNRDDSGTQFELWEGAVERIMPGAFQRSLDNNADVVALFNHDPNKILGRTPNTLKLTADQRGLHYEIEPNEQSSYTKDVLSSIERGDIKGSSFGFIPRRVNWIMDGDTEVREIHDADLIDVSPVTFPAYGSANVGLRGTQLEEVQREYSNWKAVVETEKREKIVEELLNKIGAKSLQDKPQTEEREL